MTFKYPIYVECQWCGNRWYQDEITEHKCEVCGHMPYEGTHEEHMKFPDLEAWAEFTERQKNDSKRIN